LKTDYAPAAINQTLPLSNMREMQQVLQL